MESKATVYLMAFSALVCLAHTCPWTDGANECQTGATENCATSARRCHVSWQGSNAGSLINNVGPFHEGVLVTLETGEKKLVQKGNNYGTSTAAQIDTITGGLPSGWSFVGQSTYPKYANIVNYYLAASNAADSNEAADDMMDLN